MVTVSCHVLNHFLKNLGPGGGRCVHLFVGPCSVGWWPWMLVRPHVLAPQQETLAAGAEISGKIMKIWDASEE